MRQTFSFDIGGVLDRNVEIFLRLTSSLVSLGHRVIAVTAIGHGLPEKWGFTEEARYATSYARLLRLGYVQTKHFHEVFVTPDVDGHPTTTGRYKNFILDKESALIHIDDNPEVLKGITCCLPFLWQDNEAELLETCKKVANVRLYC
jgi:hypothetical protein